MREREYRKSTKGEKINTDKDREYLADIGSRFFEDLEDIERLATRRREYSGAGQEDTVGLTDIPEPVQHGVDEVSEKDTPETETEFDPETTSSLIPLSCSLDSLKHLLLLPLKRDGDILLMGAPSLEVYPQAQLFASLSGCHADIEERSSEWIEKCFSALYDMQSGIAQETVEAVEGIDDLDSLAREDVLSDSIDVPIIRLVNSLLREAVRERATDIHVEPSEERVAVRFRVDGVLNEKLSLPKGHQAPLTSRIKVMARMDIAERYVPQDGRIGIRIGDRDVDIRVGSIPTRHGERIALRILDTSSGLISLEELGMDSSDMARHKALLSHPEGMVLFTGPTGSGKTTTMYAILQSLSRPNVNIITVEDPVEYDLPGISQIQVNERAGVTFASALRSILRQDPDIIMVGEMRDFETAHIGVQSSLTGHMVLSTLHTNDSSSAVVRLLDMGVEPYLCGASLLGVVAQRLVRRVCPRCMEPVRPPAFLKDAGMEISFRGKGCEHCLGTGYRGRVGLFEHLVVDEDMRQMIVSGETAGTIRQRARTGGMRTLWESGVEKVKAGATSADELLRVLGGDQL